jgi:DNA ligase 1
VQLLQLVTASRAVAETPRRGEKVAILADLLRRVSPAEVEAAVGLLTGQPRQGRIGVGWATLAATSVDPASDASLTVGELDDALGELAELAGEGSQRRRGGVLHALLARATADEQWFVVRTLTGELRQGALLGVLAEAVAAAADRPAAEVRRAAMLLGDLGVTARRALAGDPLDGIGLQVGVGVQPMLAGTSSTVAEALAATGPASVEWKLDGARVQVHRRDGEVRIFTRSLNEISDRLPGMVSAVSALPGGDVVLDGEALGLDADGQPLDFQDSMSVRAELRPFFFDVLAVEGSSLIDEALSVRKAALAAVVPAHLRLPTLDVVDPLDPAPAVAFADEALRAGHEGVMVKSLASTYRAGRRGTAWRKVKPVHTLDLVVLAAEWGHGRRRGWLSNLHLGARGPEGTFVMVGKTFKGLTDALLRWQTATFPDLALGDDGSVMHLRPELVVEIAVDGVQRSTRYPGGVALRFARVRRYRPDKSAAEADSIERVRAMR